MSKFKVKIGYDAGTRISEVERMAHSVRLEMEDGVAYHILSYGERLKISLVGDSGSDSMVVFPVAPNAVQLKAEPW